REYRRWRHEGIEGLAPAEDAARAARTGDRARKVIGTALRALRGDGPIPDVAVIALARSEDYYTFLAPHHPEEGEWATSGGTYVNLGPGALAMIVTHTQAKWGLEETVAHELTHHALEELSLPLWVEEGFTQMMEERVTGLANFKLDREMVERQRALWEERGVEGFLSGDGFFSAEEDVQELSYHLSQWVVRSQLSERAGAFFAFAREAGELGESESAMKHLGMTPGALVASVGGLECE
ncbi:MAG: hypothetical protein WD749_11790, partial [Phycisphaerales bacterium]